MTSINTKYNYRGYYISIFHNEKTYSTDSEISKLLGMTIEAYCDLTKSKFNCMILENQVFFETNKDIKRFSRWLKTHIEYYLVMKELAPDRPLER